MSKKIRVGIVGYGNLGRGVELALAQNEDFETVGVYTRRDPATVETEFAETPVHEYSMLEEGAAPVDVLILCGGSRDDLPEQSPALAKFYSTVDSYDNHARVPEHYEALDRVASRAKTVAVMSAGWDPGLFSLNRLYGELVLPVGETYTFWGKGLSQGHSDAVRRVDGVADGVQYTIPSESAIERVRSGEQPELTTREKHERHCYVVLEEGADPEAVREAITTMPDYFEPYETKVNFISSDELARDHAGMPHGGFVIRSGETGRAEAPVKQVIEYRLQLDSNPQFTASVLVASARATARMASAGASGAKTLFDIPPALLSARPGSDLRRDLL